MKKPKDLDGCPRIQCDGALKLIKEPKVFKPKGKPYIMKGDWWVYVCDGCGERFTTTESDEISLNNLKKISLKSQK